MQTKINKNLTSKLKVGEPGKTHKALTKALKVSSEDSPGVMSRQAKMMKGCGGSVSK